MGLSVEVSVRSRRSVAKRNASANRGEAALTSNPCAAGSPFHRVSPGDPGAVCFGQ
jgi:hypothetical protein